MTYRVLKLALIVISICLYATQLLLSGLNEIANDPGLGWHLQSGLYILHKGALPTPEPFLATVGDLPVVVYQWLGDIFFALLYNSMSWPGLYAFLISFSLTLVWGALFGMALYLSHSLYASVPLTLITSTLIGMHLILRPVLFQLIFFSCMVFFLLIFYRRLKDDDELKLSDGLTLVGLMTLWTNCHPSFVVGIFLVAFLCFCTVIDDYLAGKMRGTRLGMLACLLFLAGSATLINPFGLRLHRFIFRYLSTPEFRIQSEWFPPAGDSLEFLLLTTCCIIFLGFIFLARKNWREIGSFPILLPLPFLAISFQTVRYIPLAAVTSLLVCALLTRYVLGKFAPRLLEDEPDLQQQYRLSFGLTAILVIAVSAGTIVTNRVPLYNGNYGQSADFYPHDAVHWLEKQPRTSAGPLTLLNHPDWGGFLTLQGYPEIQPLFDDRFYLIEKSYLKAMLTMLHKPDPVVFNTLLTRNFDFALFPTQSEAEKWLSQTYPNSVVYSDERCTIFDNSIAVRSLADQRAGNRNPI